MKSNGIFDEHICKLNEYFQLSFPRRRESTALKENGYPPTRV